MISWSFSGHRLVYRCALLAFCGAMLAMSALQVRAQNVLSQCPEGTYPYANRPCNQGQAYEDVRRQANEWLAARPDFVELVNVEHLPGDQRYQALCSTFTFPHIPVTGCGITYYRPGSTCTSQASMPSDGTPEQAMKCEAGCEVISTASNTLIPSGQVCVSAAAKPLVEKNNCCQTSAGE